MECLTELGWTEREREGGEGGEGGEEGGEGERREGGREEGGGREGGREGGGRERERERGEGEREGGEKFITMDHLDRKFGLITCNSRKKKSQNTSFNIPAHIPGAFSSQVTCVRHKNAKQSTNSQNISSYSSEIFLKTYVHVMYTCILYYIYHHTPKL